MKTLILAAVAGTALTANAGTVVPDRTTLNTLLGASAVTEGFENYSVTSGSAVELGADLNSTTVVNGQGPGLVLPGLDFAAPASNIQLDGANYYSAPSNEILSNATTLTIGFSSPQHAFGLDLRDFSGFSLTGSVTVYATDNTTVLDTYTGIGVTGTPTFFGYENSAGIGSVSLTSGSGWSPIIDNVEFGSVAATPEPSTMVMLLAGLGALVAARKRRKA